MLRTVIRRHFIRNIIHRTQQKIKIIHQQRNHEGEFQIHRTTDKIIDSTGGCTSIRCWTAVHDTPESPMNRYCIPSTVTPPQQRKISLGPVNGLEYEFTKSHVFLLFNRGLYINLTHVTTVPSLFPRQADCETAASEHRNP